MLFLLLECCLSLELWRVLGLEEEPFIGTGPDYMEKRRNETWREHVTRRLEEFEEMDCFHLERVTYRYEICFSTHVTRENLVTGEKHLIADFHDLYAPDGYLQLFPHKDGDKDIDYAAAVFMFDCGSPMQLVNVEYDYGSYIFTFLDDEACQFKRAEEMPLE